MTGRIWSRIPTFALSLKIIPEKSIPLLNLARVSEPSVPKTSFYYVYWQNMTSMRKVISYIAMSLDGYIAKPDGDISFLSIAEKKGEDYGYSDFTSTIDTVIIGRKTYDQVISMGYEYPDNDNDVYVITRTVKPDNMKLK